MIRLYRSILALLIWATLTDVAHAADWPQWGHDNSRNMVSNEKHLPASADAGKPGNDAETIDASTTKNVKWVAKLGNQTYGNPTVAAGRVFVGTNNGVPRIAARSGDLGVLMCLSESDGSFLWQLGFPKLKVGKVSDWEQVGLCSSPTVDGDRLYLVNNRCQVVCLNAAGNTASHEGQVVWQYDMRDELGVFPRNMTSSSVLVVGDRLYVTTSNGIDWTSKHLPAPDAPALVCLDKQTGKLLGRERSGISARTWVCNWSSPAYGTAGKQPMVIFGGGDGFCYGFDPAPSPPGPDGMGTLRELWRFDCNPPEHRTKDGQPIKYGLPEGPSEVIATPVFVDGRVYVAVGQEPESGDGVGCLNCINAIGASGDISANGAVWRYTKLGRSLSTVAVQGDLLFTAELAGLIHCLDARTGTPLWTHDTEAHIWGGTLLADGKLYAGNESGQLVVLAASREKKLLSTIDLKDAIDSTPVAANGTLFVATQTQLYALSSKE